MRNFADAPTITGTVTELDVGGHGPNSGQLEFSITPLPVGPAAQTFAVWMDTEDRVFTSMTMMLMMAYHFKTPVTVEYLTQPGQTPKALNVKVPADVKKGPAG
jgi:hypothetical protein